MVVQFVFVSVPHMNFQETSIEIKVRNCQCYCKKQINNTFPWSVLLSTIEMSKYSKLCSETTCLQLRFYLSFEHFDVISMVDKSTDHGILLLTC